jgi:hypothetical protein
MVTAFVIGVIVFIFLIAYGLAVMTAPSNDFERGVSDEEQIEYLNAYVAEYMRKH